MAVESNFFGSVTVSGEGAKAFTGRLAYSRSTRAAITSARNGRILANDFANGGSVVIHAKPSQKTSIP